MSDAFMRSAVRRGLSEGEAKQQWRELEEFRRWVATRFAATGVTTLSERKMLDSLMKEVTGFEYTLTEEKK